MLIKYEMSLCLFAFISRHDDWIDRPWDSSGCIIVIVGGDGDMYLLHS